MMRKFKSMDDMMRSLDREVAGLKQDILAAVGAEMASKISEETGGEVTVVPTVTSSTATMNYESVGDEAKIERHASALKRLNDHLLENMEAILRRRKVI